MKTRKSKGFTLIELLVVISIIALLSSVVIASLKSAREKAMLAKTVSEMKSLQTALELYVNKFGYYPTGTFWNYSDDPGYSYINDAFFYRWPLEDFLKTELVNNKFISKVPHAPNYPNNCITDGCEYAGGYVLGYATFDINSGNFFKDADSEFSCGGQKIKNYLIYLIAPIDKKLNLPILYFLGETLDDYTGYGPANVYCLTM